MSHAVPSAIQPRLQSYREGILETESAPAQGGRAHRNRPLGKDQETDGTRSASRSSQRFHTMRIKPRIRYDTIATMAARAESGMTAMIPRIAKQIWPMTAAVPSIPKTAMANAKDQKLSIPYVLADKRRIASTKYRTLRVSRASRCDKAILHMPLIWFLFRIGRDDPRSDTQFLCEPILGCLC